MGEGSFLFRRNPFFARVLLVVAFSIPLWSLAADEPEVAGIEPSWGELKAGQSAEIEIASDYDNLWLIFDWEGESGLELSLLHPVTGKSISKRILKKKEGIFSSARRGLSLSVRAMDGDLVWYCYALTTIEGLEHGLLPLEAAYGY
jgi:hypothetical protein